MLTLDKAGWHTTRKLQVPFNISLVHLPPASPELNPTENVWQFMRQAYLSNRVFRDYDDVVEISSSAWNKLIAEQGRIASIGTRSWTAISASKVRIFLRKPVESISYVVDGLASRARINFLVIQLVTFRPA